MGQPKTHFPRQKVEGRQKERKKNHKTKNKPKSKKKEGKREGKEKKKQERQEGKQQELVSKEGLTNFLPGVSPKAATMAKY